MSSSYLFRGTQSPRDESYKSFSNTASAFRTPEKYAGGMVNSTGGEVRGGLTRRFTTNALPTLSPIGQQRLQAAGDNALSLGYNRVAPSERKIRHIENLLEQQRRINAELEQVDNETRREIEEGLRHERAVTEFMAQSEPTTPPEFQEPFPAPTHRQNRYSMSGIVNRMHRSSTQITSPPASLTRPYTSHTSSAFPSQSVPGSRRHSDDEEDEEYLFSYDAALHRAAANPNRNSMPVTSSYARKRSAADLSAALGPLNTTSFLFDDDERVSIPAKPNGRPSPPEGKTYLQMQHTPDGFPKLIRRDDNVERSLSGASAALDLALSETAKLDFPSTERATVRRHRVSLPPTALYSNGTMAPFNSVLATSGESKTLTNNNNNNNHNNNRRSVDVKYGVDLKRPSLITSPQRGLSNGSAKGLSSYSTNDIPTLKSINNEPNVNASLSPPQANPTMLEETNTVDLNGNNGFASPGNPRQSQEPAGSNMDNVFNTPLNSNLHGNAVPFGSNPELQAQPFNLPNMPYGAPAFYGGYGVHMLNNGFNAMSLNGNGYNAAQVPQWPNGGANPYMQGGPVAFQQNQQRQAGTGAARFSRATIPGAQNGKDGDDAYNTLGISQLHGQIYGLCKDQHGCRFLQRKLDERREQDVQIIFDEVKEHFTELMTDPFGNYLCQRLLEHANNDQRTVLIKNAAPSMTSIAVNQHGTRALQRMIEFISTPEQIRLLIDALGSDVVQLIQDLNGNHVIQKCLNHLTSEDAEFIFGAVGTNCVTVGTHRHGCCVLQRCVDHASGQQKTRLVNSIIDNALALVQDPFGNYVVQYVLDLSDNDFTRPLCLALSGHIALLSKQKFSSNVIEKCMRCADVETRRVLIQEIMVPSELEKLLRDSFANYVVQTAMDHCPDDLKTVLVESIRPVLPNIRNTPHGRRIATKIQDYDFPGNNNNWNSNGPKNGQNGSGAVPSAQLAQIPNGRGNRMGMIGPSAQWSAPVDSSSSSSIMNGHGNNGMPTSPQPAPGFQQFDLQNYPKQAFALGPFGANGSNGMGSPPQYGHL